MTRLSDKPFSGMVALLVLLGASVLSAGCERSNAGPPDAGRNRDATIDTTDSGADAAAGPDGGDLDGGGDAQVDAGDSGSLPDGGCDGTGGCWACAPTTSEQLLNRCTTAACTPFPNTRTRLPALREDGTLPPLD